MRDPNLAISREPSPLDVEWFQVQKLDNPFHLWIVEHDPQTDLLTCTCEAREWCSHRAAVAEEIEAAEARAEAADRLAFSLGLY